MIPVFIAYLKQHRKSILLFALFALIFLAVIYLYRLPAAAVGYGALLCAAAGGVISGLDFIGYWNRHKRLRQIGANPPVAGENLPVPRNPIERDYQFLLEEVLRERDRLFENAETARLETMDYYTLWVHQIKTPIAAIRLLLQEEENGQSRELQSELFKIEQYVEMVLSYLRLESSVSDFVIGRHDLDAMVRQAVRKYAPQFIRKKIALECGNLTCRVLTDEKWLVFVLEQLLSNAVKYTPHRGRVRIFLKPPAVLVIEDSGIGIAREDLPRVFEKGFTGYNGRADKKATGIGLYLSKRILDKLCHSIRLESEPGQGTRALLSLESASQARD